MDELLYDLFGRSEKEIEFGDLLVELQNAAIKLRFIEDALNGVHGPYISYSKEEYEAAHKRVTDAENKLKEIAFGKDGE